MRNLALAATLLLSPLVARADAVGPLDPAVVCPAGSQVDINHCGTVCVPSRCTLEGACREPGQVCQPVDLCVEDEPYCGGWTSDAYERVRGTCASGCGSYECRTLTVCAPEPSAETDSGSDLDAGSSPVLTYGCGCRALGRRAEGWGGSLVLVGLLVLVRRRR